MTQGKLHVNPALMSLNPGFPFWSQDKSKCNWWYWQKNGKDIFISKHIYCTPATSFCPRVGVVQNTELFMSEHGMPERWMGMSLESFVFMPLSLQEALGHTLTSQTLFNAVPPIFTVRQQPLQMVWHQRSLRNPDFIGEIDISRNKLFRRILKFFGDFKDMTEQ